MARNKGESRRERETLSVDGKKRCTKCRKVKGFDAFSDNAQNADGLAYYCRPCNAGKMRQWKREHVED